MSEGTKPPVSSYKSPFIGKKAEDVAKWLKDRPEDADIDIHFFTILDKSAKEGSIVVGRQGGYNLKDLDNLEFIRLDAEFGVSLLYGGKVGLWEDVQAGRRSKDLDNIEY